MQDKIDKAFYAALRRFDDALNAPLGKTKPDFESEFYALSDLTCESGRIEIEDITHAYELGQKHPSANKYVCWWGTTFCCFIGNPQDIIDKLEAYQPFKGD